MFLENNEPMDKTWPTDSPFINTGLALTQSIAPTSRMPHAKISEIADMVAKNMANANVWTNQKKTIVVRVMNLKTPTTKRSGTNRTNLVQWEFDHIECWQPNKTKTNQCGKAPHKNMNWNRTVAKIMGAKWNASRNRDWNTSNWLQQRIINNKNNWKLTQTYTNLFSGDMEVNKISKIHPSTPYFAKENQKCSTVPCATCKRCNKHPHAWKTLTFFVPNFRRIGPNAPHHLAKITPCRYETKSCQYGRLIWCPYWKTLELLIIAHTDMKIIVEQTTRNCNQHALFERSTIHLIQAQSWTICATHHATHHAHIMQHTTHTIMHHLCNTSCTTSFSMYVKLPGTKNGHSSPCPH